MKGIIYCRSKALCEKLADALACPAYHADVAGRADVLDAWRQSGGLIACTSALGVGVDIPHVLFTLHVEQPWGMIDFVQESGRARGPVGKAIILLVQPLRQAKAAAYEGGGSSSSENSDEADSEEEQQRIGDSEAMEAFVRTLGCRRAVMSRYMDGNRLSCSALREPEIAIEAGAGAAVGAAAATAVEVAACDNCEERQRGGRRAWQEEQALHAAQERLVRSKLDELAQTTCPYCWAILHEVFDGRVGEAGREEQEAAVHSLWQCPRLGGAEGIEEMDEVRREIRYRREVRTCFKCGMMDKLCERESNREESSSTGGSSRRQEDCAWPHVVMPILWGLRAAAEAKVTQDGDSARIRTGLRWAGYKEEDSSKARFAQWIGRSCSYRRVFGRVVSNGVVVVIAAILEESRE